MNHLSKKVIAVICIIILISIDVIFTIVQPRNEKRYEQHLQALKTQDSGSIEEDNLISHLPIISIFTNGQEIPESLGGNSIVSYNEEEIKVEISIYDNEEAQNSVNNIADLKSDALLKIRGNTSRYFDKSSYKITFIDDKENQKKYEVMGMEKSDEWALYGPFLDKTLIRNYMWLNISAQIMGDAPNVRFCECYINGEYKGLYVMMETIQKSNISLYNKNSNDVQYLVKLDKLDGNTENELSYYSNKLKYHTGFSIVYPGTSKLTSYLKEYIQKDIENLEEVLYSENFKDEYDKYIDVDSWVDFYIISEFVLNTDMCSYSTYLYKNKDGKFVMGPVWDFNNVCDNYLSKAIDIEGFHFKQERILYEMLLQDEKFVKKVQDRYKELRNTYLNEDYLMNYIDETVEYLGEAINRNYEVWGYTLVRENQLISNRQYLIPVERNPESYEEAIEQYKNFIIKRGSWLDNNIDYL